MLVEALYRKLPCEKYTWSPELFTVNKPLRAPVGWENRLILPDIPNSSTIRRKLIRWLICNCFFMLNMICMSFPKKDTKKLKKIPSPPVLVGPFSRTVLGQRTGKENNSLLHDCWTKNRYGRSYVPKKGRTHTNPPQPHRAAVTEMALSGDRTATTIHHDKPGVGHR